MLDREALQEVIKRKKIYRLYEEPPSAAEQPGQRQAAGESRYSGPTNEVRVIDFVHDQLALYPGRWSTALTPVTGVDPRFSYFGEDVVVMWNGPAEQSVIRRMPLGNRTASSSRGTWVCGLAIAVRSWAPVGPTTRLSKHSNSTQQSECLNAHRFLSLLVNSAGATSLPDLGKAETSGSSSPRPGGRARVSSHV